MSVSEISPPRRHTSKAYLYRASNSTGLANARLKLGSFGLARHKCELATYVQMNPNFLESDLWTVESWMVCFKDVGTADTIIANSILCLGPPGGKLPHRTLRGEP